MTDSAIRDFCALQREWLELELNSESDSEHRKSHVIHRLSSAEVSVGLYGRTVIDFAKEDDALLPAHKFTTGDEVEIRSSNRNNSNSSGVVSAVTDRSISVALFPSRKNHKPKDDAEDNDENALGNPPYSLLPRSNIEVHRKVINALDELESKGVNHPVAFKIVQALFEVPSEIEYAPLQAIHPNNASLDSSQLEAISFALSTSQPVSLIHGPPGTGKTTTVVELIQQAVKLHGWKILVTAPSNVAVDNVLSKLVAEKPSRKKRQRLKVVRLGHPARLQASILPYSLEALVQGAEGTEIVDDVRSELESYLKILNGRGGDKRLAYREVKELRKELRTREERVVEELMDNAQVVLATCVGAANQKLLRDQHFDMVVIDEAAQALEAACWIPALRAGTKLVLAGDHCQLPPTIKSNKPVVQHGLAITMFERVMALYGDTNGGGRVSRMLKVQYRMHERIANWASQALYHGQLETHETVRNRTLSQLSGITPVGIDGNETSGLEDVPLLLIDTAGCDMYESENAAGSRFNEGEAQLVIQHVRKLIEMGVQQDQIAVITPYNGQVEVLRLALLPEAPKLQIRSVDGFQGGEREAVVLSLVRSSDRGGIKGIGFLKDDRRLNVAVTRAKRHCCVVADTDTVSQSPFVKNLIDWMEEHGEQRSALEMASDSADGQLACDIMQAEYDLERIMEEAVTSDATKKPMKPPTEGTLKADSTLERRESLLIRIQGFVSTHEPGAEMALSTELSKLDRKLVHEIAEELNLEHMSEGTEGKDRRIKVMIPKPKATAEVSTSGEGASEEIGETADVTTVQDESANQDVQGGEDVVDSVERSKPVSSLFAVLDVGDEKDSKEEARERGEQEVKPTTTAKPGMNSLLGDLAKERASRAAAQRQKPQSPAQPSKKKKKTKKQKPRKAKPSPEPDRGLEDLDDMAFLDAQIHKVQTSHGRKVVGKGTNYRTIINGTLLGKPNKQEKKKDARASAALQTKLKEAQNSRKTKKKK